jgi:hypothetical protein
MNSKKNQLLPKKELFYKESTKVYVPVSDGAELLVYYTTKKPDGYNIFYIPGYGSLPMSWNDLWDELYKDFNLYVLETREKISSKVKWSHKGDMNRSGLDIKDSIENLDLDQKKTFIIAASSATLYVGRALAAEMIHPKGLIAIGIIRTPVLPSKLIYMSKFTPSFLINWALKTIGKLWLTMVMPKGPQREAYKQYMQNASAMRYKKTKCLTWWDATEDYKKIKTPTWIIGAVEESMHTEHESKLIRGLIKNSIYVEVPDFSYMHHLPGARDFAKVIKDIIEGKYNS